MKQLSYALCGLVLAAVALPFVGSTEPSPPATVWEYEVVGVTDIHGSTVGNLADAIKSGKGILDKAKSTDEELAQSIEDVLDTYGQDGWELVTATKAQLIFKRRAE